MTPDGIATEDWDRVHELALEVVNTSSEGDEVASADATARLRDLLDKLQEKYGPVPSLLATRADYAGRLEDREYWLLAAYEKVEQRADVRNQVSIAESLASFYIEDRPDRKRGAEWLETLDRLLLHSPNRSEEKAAARLRAILEASVRRDD
jgi:hypothetical protein